MWGRAGSEESTFAWRRWGPGIIVVALLAIVPLAVMPAQAAGPLSAGGFYQKPTPFDDQGEFDPECKGLDVVVRFRFKGVDSIRRVRGSNGQAFFGKTRFRFRQTWVDKATDEVLLRYRGSNLFREVAARRVRKADVPERFVPEDGLVGPIFRFTARQIGAEVVTDGDGVLLYNQGGLVVFKQLFDTLGDHKPGGNPLNERVVRVVGPHPLLKVDLCDVAKEQAG